MSDNEIDEESVLMAFSMESSHGRETLERYIREYPQHAAALIDCSIDLLHEPPAGDVPATEVPDRAVDKAWQRHERYKRWLRGGDASSWRP